MIWVIFKITFVLAVCYRKTKKKRERIENGILKVGCPAAIPPVLLELHLFLKITLMLHNNFLNFSSTFLVWQKVVHSPHKKRELAACG